MSTPNPKEPWEKLVAVETEVHGFWDRHKLWMLAVVALIVGVVIGHVLK